MSDFITRTAKLIPKTKRIKPFPGYATAYHYETEGGESEALGNLYIVIEVLTNSKQAEAVVDLVIETAGNSYYNSEPSKLSVLERFENALKATNQALANYTNAGNASWVGRMSALIAVLAGKELHITQAGSSEAYLFRGNVTSHVTTGLNGKNQQRPINTFANIATGELQVQDRLVLATPAFFHLVQQPQLKTIVGDNTANASVQKLSNLINQDEESNRVAAIIVEVTTAELLALQTRSNEPDNIEVGQADKPMEVAKAFAAPVAKSLADTSKAVSAKVSTQAKTNLIPFAKKTGFSLAGAIRKQIKTRLGKLQLAITGLLLIGLVLFWGIATRHSQTLSSQIRQYDSSYLQFIHARQLFDQGNKAAARSDLTQSEAKLTQLAKSVDQADFNQKLAKRAHSESEPSSIAVLEADMKGLMEQIEGIVGLSTATLSDFSQFKNAKPTKMTLIGHKLIIFDSQNGTAIYSYDTSSKTLSLLSKGNNQLGKVVTLTPSSDGAGLFLLTDKPDVWYLRVLDGNLAEQSLNIGSWPKGRSIATYNNSLYILADDSAQLYKFSPTSAGFAAPSNYFANESVVKSTTSLAIDGQIYLAGGQGGLRRFTSGKLDQSLASIPKPLQNPAQLLIINGDDRLLLLDGISNHLGLFTNNPNSINFQKELILNGSKTVSAIATDSKSTILYALADGKLISAPLPK